MPIVIKLKLLTDLSETKLFNNITNGVEIIIEVAGFDHFCDVNV